MKELVPIALNGFASSWKPFVQGVCAHENLPTFDKLWDDFVQEEIRLESCSKQKRSRRPSPHWEDEEGKQERTQEG
jgi:hypothetical protein